MCHALQASAIQMAVLSVAAIEAGASQIVVAITNSIAQLSTVGAAQAMATTSTLTALQTSIAQTNAGLSTLNSAQTQLSTQVSSTVVALSATNGVVAALTANITEAVNAMASVPNAWASGTYDTIIQFPANFTASPTGLNYYYTYDP
jgi:ABC-type transporter Mla subunit MlaD